MTAPLERRRLTDENVIWFVAEVVPVLAREIRDPIVLKLTEGSDAQALVNDVHTRAIAAVTSAVHGHTLQCFVVSMVTAAAVSAGLWAYWR